MMKSETRLLVGWMFWAAALISCDGIESLDRGALIERSEDAPPSDPAAGSRDSWGVVGARTRTRSGVGVADPGQSQRTRFESRIGLQPWPDDLPAGWPKPEWARVVATTTQQHGNRLVLVDIPGSPAQALAAYRDDLEAVGYRVVRPRSREGAHALDARLDGMEVVLRFFARDRRTRLEILFIDRRTG